MRSIAFSRLKADVLALYEPPLKRPGTYRHVRQVLEELEALPCVKRSTDLTAPTIAAWLKAHAGDARGPARKLGLLKTMRTITRYAEFSGHLLACPFRWRPPQKWIADELEEYEKKDRHLPAIEALRILARADAEATPDNWIARRLRALVYLLTFTGVRRSEALGLKVEDLDFDERIFHIRPNERRKLKTKKSRATLGLSRDLIKVLRPWSRETGCEWLFPGTRKTGPWLDGAPGSRALDHVRALGERCGIKGLTILSFRHTVGTVAEPAGLDELELQRLLRHNNPHMQKNYRHRDEANVRRIADKIARGYKSAVAGVPRELLTPRVS